VRQYRAILRNRTGPKHNAKLIWPVSLDGKKMQSETYKILGILDKPKTN